VNATFLRLAAALVRWWTTIYTWGMPTDARHARRAEIDSDLWECQHGEPPTRWLPAQVLLRLVLGIGDDIAWRGEQLPRRLRRAQTTFAVAITAAAVLGALWIELVGRAASLPPVPPSPFVFVKAPPPPPPPPPPCNPPGIGPAPTSPCSRF
jgi:hypothetical protein